MKVQLGPKVQTIGPNQIKPGDNIAYVHRRTKRIIKVRTVDSIDTDTNTMEVTRIWYNNGFNDGRSFFNKIDIYLYYPGILKDLRL